MSEQDNLVVPGSEEQILLTSKSTAAIPIKRNMPCITILVHGVNDVGEAFAKQEAGLCAGLNTRLDRKDILAGDWALPPEMDKYSEKDVLADPDKVYFQRKPDQGTSSVIPFYWGFREEEDQADTKQPHKEYLDRYGNRIDKRFGKNGGPFANATTNIPDMFGEGFRRNWAIRRADPEDGTHPLMSAPPRTYMVLAAQRLAALLRIIRKKSPNEPVNIIAHSQGCFVTLLAHAMLGKEGGGIKADTVVLNNPPYSLEEPFIETFQTGSEQQTSHAREETLRKIVADFMTTAPATVPAFASLKTEGEGVVGRLWEASAKKERDNRGKVFLYFSPDDATVGLPNIQGIGWWGVYEGMRQKLGGGFYQRMFASPLGKNADAPPVGSAPYEYKIHFKWNVGHTFGRKRHINAEPLHVTFVPEMGAAKLQNGAIDAAIGATSPYDKKGQEGMLANETAEQAKARWMNLNGDNSYHSSIVSNAMHTEKSTAYDVCIGVSEILKTNDVKWITFLRAAADWRTNWHGLPNRKALDDPAFPPPAPEIVAMLKGEIEPVNSAIINGNYHYHAIAGDHPGKLPGFTTACTVATLDPFVISETTMERYAEQQRRTYQIRGHEK
jgi:pimeloyl-ACP methyl ester carboxylesterase